MWLSRYFVYFVIYGIVGWIYECIFVSVCEKKWENRGFLYGPLIPIYGIGGAALMILMDLAETYSVSYAWWQVFLIGCAGSFVLEYSTHWALEKLFHAYWWDYSAMPLNIKGRVCLPYTFCFGLAAILCVYVIIPFFVNITGWINPFLFELFGLVCAALVAADTALTVSALTDFNLKLIDMEKVFNDRMGQLVENGVAAMDDMKLQKTFAEKLPNLSGASPAEFLSKFSSEQISKYMSGIGRVRKSALKRVRGYRNPKLTQLSLDMILKELKKKLPKNLMKTRKDK